MTHHKRKRSFTVEEDSNNEKESTTTLSAHKKTECQLTLFDKLPLHLAKYIFFFCTFCDESASPLERERGWKLTCKTFYQWYRHLKYLDNGIQGSYHDNPILSYNGHTLDMIYWKKTKGIRIKRCMEMEYAFCLICYNGDLDLMKEILSSSVSQKKNISWIDPSMIYNTPLLLASNSGNWEIVRELLNYEKVTSKQEGMSDVLQTLINYYRKFDAPTPIGGNPPSIPEFISSLQGSQDPVNFSHICTLNYQWMRAFLGNNRIVKTSTELQIIVRSAMKNSCENDDLKYLVFMLDFYQKEESTDDNDEIILSCLSGSCNHGSINTGLHLLSKYKFREVDLVISLKRLCVVNNKGTGLITVLLDTITIEGGGGGRRQWPIHQLLTCIPIMSHRDELNENLKEFLSHSKIRQIMVDYKQDLEVILDDSLNISVDRNNTKIVETITNACTLLDLNLRECTISNNISIVTKSKDHDPKIVDLLERVNPSPTIKNEVASK